jgi:quercetin dioxygenase-like cupin family protein
MGTSCRLVVAGIAALAAFWSGFAVGQRSAPSGDSGVEQTLLATIDLAKALAGFPDRQMRLNRVTIAPGGHIGLHGHADDPTVVYLVNGTIINHHEDGHTEELRAGQAFAEFGQKAHWVENKGPAPVTFVFTSVSRRQ